MYGRPYHARGVSGYAENPGSNYQMDPGPAFSMADTGSYFGGPPQYGGASDPFEQRQREEQAYFANTGESRLQTMIRQLRGNQKLREMGEGG
jgi:hypothetical protein